MVVIQGNQLRQEAIKNLLSAQKRIAENGTAKEVVRITRYLLKASKQFDKILVDIGPEDD